jgi:hypothetical protein
VFRFQWHHRFEAGYLDASLFKEHVRQRFPKQAIVCGDKHAKLWRGNRRHTGPYVSHPVSGQNPARACTHAFNSPSNLLAFDLGRPRTQAVPLLQLTLQFHNRACKNLLISLRPISSLLQYFRKPLGAWHSILSAITVP